MWKSGSNSILFWSQITLYAPELGKLALRIFKTPANSVSSERSFSCQHLYLIHDKKRNKISSERADKLVYIYVNKRVLDRSKHSCVWEKDPECVSEEEMIEKEDKFIASGGHVA